MTQQQDVKNYTLSFAWLRNTLWQYRTGIAFFHDVLMAGLSLPVALFLRVGSDFLAPQYSAFLLYGIPLFIISAVISYRVLGLYRGIWRYASIPDLAAIMKACALALVIFLPVLFMINRLENMPRTVPILQWGLLVMMLGGSRFGYRIIQRRFWQTKDEKDLQQIPVLLYGASDGAELFIRTTQKGPSMYKPVGIIDDRPRQKGGAIHGVPVLGRVRDLSAILEKLAKKNIKPQRMIVTYRDDLKTRGRAIRQLADAVANHGMTMAQLPRMTDFHTMSGGDSIQLKSIAIEDLLGRPQKVMNRDSISAMLKNKRVLITGAGGSIGSEIVMQVAGFKPAAMCLIDNSEHNLYQIEMGLREKQTPIPLEVQLCDVRDRARVEQVFNAFRPDVVFHAAAYKHVPMVEKNPAEGVLTNVIGTRNVAETAKLCGAEAMVQISTDKAVNPTNIMGATKKLAETYCQALDLMDDGSNTRYMTVRFGNVLGSSGSVVPLFRRQLERGGPLTVTDPKIERFFMTIPEAVGLVLSASAFGLNTTTHKGQIFVLDMGEPVKIDDVARQMIRLSGLVPDQDIKIVYTGLRPGEKMYEELFNETEIPVATDLKGVNAAMPTPLERPVLLKAIQDLDAAARVNDTNRLHRILKTFVPGYGHLSGQGEMASTSFKSIKN